MKLEPLMTYKAELGPPHEVGTGPGGTRRIVPVTGGRFEGPKLKGRILPEAGADWLMIGADGVGRLDVRGTFETDDGAFLYVRYRGVLHLNEKVANALAGEGSTEYGDTYFMTQPVFETGDERYAWLNSVVAVAEGRVLPAAVEYRVHQLVNG